MHNSSQKGYAVVAIKKYTDSYTSAQLDRSVKIHNNTFEENGSHE